MATTETDQSRKIVAAAFDAWRTGQAPITDVFAPDMTWRIEGTSVVAGAYDTTADFVAEVLAPFAARFPVDAPFRPTVIRSVVADGDTVVVVWDGRGTATDGVDYVNSYAWVLRLRDGRVVDGTAFFDSKAFDDLWARVAPRT